MFRYINHLWYLTHCKSTDVLFKIEPIVLCQRISFRTTTTTLLRRVSNLLFNTNLIAILNILLKIAIYPKIL